MLSESSATPNGLPRVISRPRSSPSNVFLDPLKSAFYINSQSNSDTLHSSVRRTLTLYPSVNICVYQAIQNCLLEARSSSADIESSILISLSKRLRKTGVVD